MRRNVPGNQPDDSALPRRTRLANRPVNHFFNSFTLCCREGAPMKLRMLILGLAIAFSTGVLAADPKEIEAKVAELNRQSIKLLGVSLNALRYLVEAEPHSYLLLSHLQRSGEINFV